MLSCCMEKIGILTLLAGFIVNGSAIPEVDFDVGESYAGLLPIGSANETDQLYFWFFPTSASEDPKEIIIWLTGGVSDTVRRGINTKSEHATDSLTPQPGCSSTGELISENGPFSWKAGTWKPVRNEWSWHHASNVVWVDQPIGTGFSQGTVTATNTIDVARQFMGFWKNFVDTFSLQGYKIYIAGSSYSGQWSPYLASEMLDTKDDDYFDVAGVMVYDGVFGHLGIHQDIPLMRFTEKWNHVTAFNKSTMDQMRTIADKCGMDEYIDKYLKFPPPGEQPTDIPGPITFEGDYIPECDHLTLRSIALSESNPCYSPYNVLVHCPRQWDVLGLGEGRYESWAPGPIYFDRRDVKLAINAPADLDWRFCTKEPPFVDGVNTLYNVLPGSLPVLPGVIDRTKNVILGHGLLDFIALSEGTLLTIQNLTFGGQLGFQSPPELPLYVPSRPGSMDFETHGSSGTLGRWHHERGLTYFETESAGHFVGRDAPSVALRAVEVLLGRVTDFSSQDPFTVS